MSCLRLRVPSSFASEKEFRVWAREAVLARAKALAKSSAEDRQMAAAIEPYEPEVARRLRAVADERDGLVDLFRSILTSN